MAEGSRDEAVKPYRFEILANSDYSDNEEGTSELETSIREQASFTEQMGTEGQDRSVKLCEMYAHYGPRNPESVLQRSNRGHRIP